MKESQIKSQLLFTSPNPLPWEGLELVTNKPTNNEPITIELLSIPTQGSPFNQLPIKLGNYSIIINMDFTKLRGKIKRDMINNNQRDQLK